MTDYRRLAVCTAIVVGGTAFAGPSFADGHVFPFTKEVALAGVISEAAIPDVWIETDGRTTQAVLSWPVALNIFSSCHLGVIGAGEVQRTTSTSVTRFVATGRVSFAPFGECYELTPSALGIYAMGGYAFREHAAVWGGGFTISGWRFDKRFPWLPSLSVGARRFEADRPFYQVVLDVQWAFNPWAW